MKTLLKRQEVAKLLNVSLRAIDARIAAGDIPIMKIGRSVRFRPEAIEQFVEVHEHRVRGWKRRR